MCWSAGLGEDLVNIIRVRNNIWNNSLYSPHLNHHHHHHTTTPKSQILDVMTEPSPLPLLAFLIRYFDWNQERRAVKYVWITDSGVIVTIHDWWLFTSLLNWFVASSHQRSDDWLIELCFGTAIYTLKISNLSQTTVYFDK